MRTGNADWKVLAIVGMAIVIILFLAVQFADDGGSPPPEEPTDPPSRDIIKVRKKEGNTYRTSIVGQVKGEAVNKNWLYRRVVHYLYRWELVYDSEILQNDGKTIKEERRFLVAKIFLTNSTRKVEISNKWLVSASVSALGSYFGAHEAGAWLEGAEIGLNKLLDMRPGVEEIKVRWEPHSLEGKKAILRIPDTMNNTNVEVSGSSLTEEERELLREVSLLLDARTLPKEDMEPGESWTVPASEMAQLLDLDLGGNVTGTLRLKRLKDRPAEGSTIVPLQLDLNATQREQKAGNAVRGRYMADGTGLFNKRHGILEEAELDGKATYSKVSTDHMLFEARHEDKPNLSIQYNCYNIDDPSVSNIKGKNADMEDYLEQAPEQIQQMGEEADGR